MMPIEKNTYDNSSPTCTCHKEIKRIDGRYIASEIASVFNLEKGFFFTVKALLFQPAQQINIFLLKDRTRLVKPMTFILICSLIYTLFEQLFDFEKWYFDFQILGSASTVSMLFKWITQNIGYSNIIMSVFVVLWIKLFYRRAKYNRYEILVFLLFINGMQLLMFSALGALESTTNHAVLGYGTYLVMFYAFWATAQFLNKRRVLNYLKVLISYFLGMLTFLLCAVGIGLFVDVIK